MPHAIEFSHVSRFFGDVRAVDDVSLTINQGEFFSLLGPSGSGKTTCLRLIAGFEHPSAGTLLIQGQSAAGLAPYQRNVNTVFQDYALFPHMNVLDNVGYGLMVKGISKRECTQRAREALELVALEFAAERKPMHLSGGQRQRVALARALVNQPSVLLLDEPLGALDLKLREQMQGELKRLQRQLGITFIFVTHDQSEALSMSDRVAVFNQGRIEQIATPRTLYQTPQTAFVAQFVGTANVLASSQVQRLTGVAKRYAIRPEHIQLYGALPSDPSDEVIYVQAQLIDIHYQGAVTRYELQGEHGLRLWASEANGPSPADNGRLRVGQSVTAGWPRTAMVAL